MAFYENIADAKAVAELFRRARLVSTYTKALARFNEHRFYDEILRGCITFDPTRDEKGVDGIDGLKISRGEGSLILERRVTSWEINPATGRKIFKGQYWEKDPDIKPVPYHQGTDVRRSAPLEVQLVSKLGEIYGHPK